MVVIVLTLRLTACASTRATVSYNSGNFGTSDPPKVVAVDDTYKLAPLEYSARARGVNSAYATAQRP
jgi:polysaccharide export outer membrane protein